MLRSYATIALRNVVRHKVYALINVVGLAIGIASCLLILSYVREELSYDRFHDKADRIYRLVAGNSGDGQPTNANGAFSAAPALELDFKEVERAVRIVKMGWGEKRVFAREDRRFYEEKFFFADPGIFEVFTFPFSDGNPSTALEAPQTLVLTESAAARYFGEANPVGQALSIDPFNDGQFSDFEITGVLRDLPATSHIQFDFLLSFSSLPGPPRGWGFDPVFTYVLLAEAADPDALEARLPAFLESHVGPEPWYTLHLQPVTDIRLHSKLRAELEPGGDIAYVYIFSSVALFILLIACINFMNLATARSARRGKEVGMRKMVGARRSQLIRQFMSEAVVLSMAAGLLAIPLSEVLLPVFNAISGSRMSIEFLGDGALLAGLVALVLLVGLVAGSYPALYLSSIRPAVILKGVTRSRGELFVRKGLVIFQFALSIILIACTWVVSDQMSFIRESNLGFDRDQIMVMPLNDHVREQYATLRHEMMHDPAVLDVTMSEQVPGRAGNGAGYVIEGMEEMGGFHRLFVGPHFAETYGIEMASGRSFSDAFPSDTTEAFVVNETLVETMGWGSPEEAIGKRVQMEWSDVVRSGQIVGVAKDFNLFSLREDVTPLVANLMPYEHLNFVSLRIASGDLARALRHVDAVWSRFSIDYPLDYYFVDDDFDRLHRADQRLGDVFRAFAALAILIACLGLFGLAAFTAEQRTREIGVRKVLGATTSQVLVLLSKDFTLLVGIAFVVAAPVAYLVMSSWLEEFSYRAQIDPLTFALVGVLAVGLAWLTVSYHLT